MTDIGQVQPSQIQNVFVGADFSTLELRTAGGISGCVPMLEQFRSADAGLDIDMHSQTARRLWPDFEGRPEDERKKLRRMAKTAGFLSIYGGGAGGLFEKMRQGMDPIDDPGEQARSDDALREQCDRVQKQLEEAWPQYFQAARGWYYFALRNGWLTICHITGLRYLFPIRDRDHVSPTLCSNLPVQCTAATIAHMAGHRLLRALPPDSRIVNYVHDFYMVECPEWRAQEVAEIMRRAMYYRLEGPAGGIDIIAEPKIGYSWKDVK